MRDELQKRIISSAGKCGIINLEKSDEDDHIDDHIGVLG